jgi:hypothetical protein
MEKRAEEAALIEKIGLQGSFLSRFVSPPAGSALSRALSGINWITGGKEMLPSAAYGVRWQAFAQALAEDADAELNLG